MSEKSLSKNHFNVSVFNQQTRMSTAETLALGIHSQAMEIVRHYKNCEVDLIEILQKVDLLKVFYSLGYSSLFKYAVDGLGLSEEVAYIFINVARKSKEIPALKEEIKKGSITVSKAKRLTAVLNHENQHHWLELAKKSSKRELERQVAQVAPQQSVIEKMNYVHPAIEVHENAKILRLEQPRVQLQVGVSEKLMLKLRRAQDVLSQKKQQVVGLEKLLEEIVATYLEKYDPIEIAKRQKMRGKLIDVAETDVGAKAETSANVVKEKNMLGREAAFDSVLNNKSANVKTTIHPQLGPGPVNVSDASFAVKRKPLSAKLKHKLMLRYNGCCAHTDRNGVRCKQSRFLHIHHKLPVNQGGQNELANLEVLCAGHHKMHHLRE